MAFVYNLKQLLISLDQLIQVLIGLIVSIFKWDHKIDADETMSSYAYRHAGLWYCKPIEVLINLIMFLPEYAIYRLKWGHCKRAYESEQEHIYQQSKVH